MQQAILLLFYMSLDAPLLRSALSQGTPHQAYVYSPLLKVQSTVNPRPDLPSLAGTYCLRQYHMGKDEGSLGILLTVKHPSPLHSQDFSKLATHLPWGHEVPAR